MMNIKITAYSGIWLRINPTRTSGVFSKKIQKGTILPTMAEFDYNKSDYYKVKCSDYLVGYVNKKDAEIVEE